MELLIVVALIAIIAAVAIVLLNPWAQIGKGYDARRKHDLAVLQKVMEDYYNDKGCYPKPEQICYSEITNVCNANRVKTQTCYICGNEPTSPTSLSSYLTKLPCDPQHATKKYFYQTEASEANLVCSTPPKDAQKNCPSWYRVYSDFSTQDQESVNLNCYTGGCGVAPIYGYDYGISSPNKGLEVSNKYSFDAGDGSCQTCGTYQCCHDLGCAPNAIGRPLYGSCQTCCDVVHCGYSCPP